VLELLKDNIWEILFLILLIKQSFHTKLTLQSFWYRYRGILHGNECYIAHINIQVYDTAFILEVSHILMREINQFE